jgi:hypothetical protein
MSVSVMIAQELLGLFELDETGKVLYYRMDSDGMQGGTSPDIAGHNFYDEIAPFDNVEEFRRCVTEFTRGAKAAVMRIPLTRSECYWRASASA